MISLESCKQILEKNGEKYTLEEVRKIRELLYQIGYLEYMSYKKTKQKDGNSTDLHESINH